MIKLKWPDIPSPYWFNSKSGFQVGEVVAANLVITEASREKLALLEGELPPVGIQLRIVPRGRFLLAEPLQEYEARTRRENEERQANELLRQANTQQQQDDWRAKYKERQKAQQARAERVNAQLRLPVRWTSGLKTVLSGLSANSNGSGDNARSVNHILLLEPVNEGRFTRKANSFLCTTAKGSDGLALTERLHTHDVGANGEKYVSQITCKQCLRLVKRWDLLPSNVAPELLLD